MESTQGSRSRCRRPSQRRYIPRRKTTENLQGRDQRSGSGRVVGAAQGVDEWTDEVVCASWDATDDGDAAADVCGWDADGNAAFHAS